MTKKTAYITHRVCLEHDNGSGHPESPERLTAIDTQLNQWQHENELKRYEAPEVSRAQLERVHDSDYLDFIEQNAPKSESDVVFLDPDTRMSYHTLEAARRAAGAVVLATDLVVMQEVDRAFCAVRPPGHHAKKNRAMGFCIYNNITVGIAHALEHHGLERVALLDFDVHHGNGSENILADEPRVLFCSTFQHPFYPGEPFAQNDSRLICTPLTAGSSGADFRFIVERKWLPALEQFKPQMIFISAGFDAHKDDFLASLNFDEADYQWVTALIVEVAEKFSHGRIVSSLGGGYNTRVLALSVQAHLDALMR